MFSWFVMQFGIKTFHDLFNTVRDLDFFLLYNFKVL